MGQRDPSEYREASTKADPSQVDLIPDLVAQCIAENWDGRVPTAQGFVKVVTELSCLVLVTLCREGKLAALAGGSADVGRERHLATVIVSEILSAGEDCAFLMAKCADITFGLKLQEGKTQDSIALEHGLGKASVSAICTFLKNCYTGEPGTGMKKNSACNKYAAIRKGRRAKPMPQQWEFRDRFIEAYEERTPATNKTKRR